MNYKNKDKIESDLKRKELYGNIIPKTTYIYDSYQTSYLIYGNTDLSGYGNTIYQSMVAYNKFVDVCLNYLYDLSNYDRTDMIKHFKKINIIPELNNHFSSGIYEDSGFYILYVSENKTYYLLCQIKNVVIDDYNYANARELFISQGSTVNSCLANLDSNIEYIIKALKKGKVSKEKIEEQKFFDEI